MKAAVIVAHPDDEIIWSGGLILQHPDWDWTVLSLCRAGDPDRHPKFKSVCAYLGLNGLISDLDDAKVLRAINTRREIGHRILEHLAPPSWDLCVTHGSNGEYGHLRHKEISAEVLSLIDDGILECEQLWTFAYLCEVKKKTCRPDPQADILLNLTDKQLSEKKRIVQEQYGYSADSFEVGACISPESFHRRQKRQKEQLT